MPSDKAHVPFRFSATSASSSGLSVGHRSTEGQSTHLLHPFPTPPAIPWALPSLLSLVEASAPPLKHVLFLLRLVNILSVFSAESALKCSSAPAELRRKITYACSLVHTQKPPVSPAPPTAASSPFSEHGHSPLQVPAEQSRKPHLVPL